MDVERFRQDPAYFAEVLVGEGLWPHQREAIASPARVTCIVAGRQSGKSRTVAVAALHKAFTKKAAKVLLVSASQDSSRRLLEEVALLTRAPLLAGSVVDDLAGEIRLSNGSVVASVPASPKAIRGWSAVDMLVVDEACFVAAEIWQAARWVVISNPESRILLCSSPFGRADGWFSTEYRAGLRGEGDRASHHWPSWLNPAIDQILLDMWRKTSTAREYQAEIEGIWPDDTGAVFPAELLESVTRDFEPGELVSSLAGCDWARVYDANTLVGLAVEGAGDTAVYRVALAVEKFKRDPVDFIGEIVSEASRGVEVLISEENGIGQVASTLLARKVAEAGLRAEVVRLASSEKSKAAGYGQLLILMQQGRLLIPRSAPALLRQLSNLEYTTSEGGAERISVPERLGHDDLADALSFCGWYLSNSRVVRRAENRRKLSASASSFAAANRSLVRGPGNPSFRSMGGTFTGPGSQSEERPGPSNSRVMGYRPARPEGSS